jgi:hypothetical protein
MEIIITSDDTHIEKMTIYLKYDTNENKYAVNVKNNNLQETERENNNMIKNRSLVPYPITFGLITGILTTTGIMCLSEFCKRSCGF